MKRVNANVFEYRAQFILDKIPAGNVFDDCYLNCDCIVISDYIRETLRKKPYACDSLLEFLN